MLPRWSARPPLFPIQSCALCQGQVTSPEPRGGLRRAGRRLRAAGGGHQWRGVEAEAEAAGGGLQREQHDPAVPGGGESLGCFVI